MRAERLIFPGVGAFEQAMGVLRSKEYTEPLREYIQVKQYMSICCLDLSALHELRTIAPCLVRGCGTWPAIGQQGNVDLMERAARRLLCS
jgi:glutamine amidotransferase/cyclase